MRWMIDTEESQNFVPAGDVPSVDVRSSSQYHLYHLDPVHKIVRISTRYRIYDLFKYKSVKYKMQIKRFNNLTLFKLLKLSAMSVINN